MNDNNYGMQPDFNNQMNNSNQPKKTGFGLGILIGFLIAIIIGLSSFIVYDQFIAKEDKEKNPTEQTGNNNEQPIATPTPTPDEEKDYDINTFETGKTAINNTDQWGYELVNDFGFTTDMTIATNADKMSATLTINWAIWCQYSEETLRKIPKGREIHSSKGIHCYDDTGNATLTYQISSNRKIKEIYVSGFSQTVGYETIFMLMEDGTVEYIPLWHALVMRGLADGTTLYSYGSIENIANIVKIMPASAYPLYKEPNEIIHDAYTHIAIKTDGSFYDLTNYLYSVSFYPNYYRY